MYILSYLLHVVVVCLFILWFIVNSYSHTNATVKQIVAAVCNLESCLYRGILMI